MSHICHESARLLTTYISENYSVEREVGGGYEYLLRLTVKQFSAWLGRDATLADLDDDQVSRWLKHLQQTSGLAARTISGRRSDLLALWRHAFETGAINHLPSRVRKVSVPKPVPIAWTLEELDRILAMCRRLQGYLGNGLPRSEYFWTKFKAAYETGLRRGDLWRLSTANVRDDGTIVIMQGKTRVGHVCKMREDTVLAFRRLAERLKTNGEQYQETPLRWPHYSRAFYFWVDKLRGEAKVTTPGALHRCRKTGATYAHRADRLNGAAAYLGHTQPGYADRFYIDRSLSDEPVLPPPLGSMEPDP